MWLLSSMVDCKVAAPFLLHHLTTTADTKLAPTAAAAAFVNFSKGARAAVRLIKSHQLLNLRP